MYYYSKSTGGFYTDHDDNIPADAVEVTAEEHAALFGQQGKGMQITSDANGNPIAVDPKSLMTSDQLAAQVRFERDALVAGSDWIMSRHVDELALGGAVTLTAAQYQAWLQYRQALRDMTKQTGFPKTVTWPSAPA